MSENSNEKKKSQYEHLLYKTKNAYEIMGDEETASCRNLPQDTLIF